MIIPNTIGFAFSYAITHWIDAMGLRDCFISVSLTSFFCTYTFLAVVSGGVLATTVCEEILALR
jgi:hypothetical protein